MDKTPIEKLNSGELPKLVGWYEPRLLMRVGVRTIISSVFGQYADQRLIQAATDVAPIETIINRYNYSDIRSDDPDRRVALGENGAFWIDYIADTGDGFEPTYTTAYLLAQPHLKVAGVEEPLTAGSILIMGGDQCYPQATREEYKLRLQTPYDWAYNVPVAERKLFAIPGNHDWYDGLSAFDSLFCSARDRMSQQNGNKIGGWQCKQHRSYWAIELPYRWWIWGCDIQFSQYLDISQVNYFEAIAGLMGPGDNLIICLAEPTWMIADDQGFDEDSNFFKITSIARRRGVKICAVIAGDWHHYARYYAPGIDVHLFTSGGGGSFLHPTHTLKNEISVAWPNPKPQVSDGLETKRAPDADVAAERYDIRLKSNTPDAAEPAQASETPAPPTRGAARLKRAKERRPKVYPSKMTSFLLSLRGLAFPFRNYFFGIGIGFIYWMVTWQFYTVAGQHNISNGQIDAVKPETYWGLIAFMPLYLIQALLVSIALVAMMGGLWFLLCWYVDAAARPRWKNYLVKLLVGTSHFLVHVCAMFSLGLAFVLVHNEITPTIKAQVDKVWQGREQQPEIIRDVITETLEPITRQAIEQRQIIEREEIARRIGRPVQYPSDRELPPLRPITEAAGPTEEGGGLPYKEIRQLVGFVMYPVEMIFVGGFVGAFVWGLYWVLAGCLLRMHTEDAFAALRIQDYRNFLRMKFEPDKVTIYPIALDRTPRRDFWMAPPRDKTPPPHNPQLVATRPLDTKLIEEPIVIYSASEYRP
ncbi:MAG: hypothetical protein ACK4TL_18130 [Hyphomicrobiaceae bacterium]